MTPTALGSPDELGAFPLSPRMEVALGAFGLVIVVLVTAQAVRKPSP